MKRQVALACLLLALVLAQPSLLLAQDAAGVRVTPDRFKVNAPQGVTTQRVQTPQGQALEITSSTRTANPIVLELGWMDAKPNTSYQGRFQVQPVTLDADASVYLLIREHPRKDARPITPYHKTSPRHRTVSQADTGKWLTRSLSLATGEKTTQLSGSIIIDGFEGKLLVAAFELSDKPAVPVATAPVTQASSQALLAQLKQQADARRPLVPRTLVYSRSQMKYGLERFYDHEWIDRPLFVSREYRESKKHVTGLASYKRILEEVAQYDIDGLAFFPETTGRMGMFDLHTQAGVPGVGLLPEFIPRLGNNDPFLAKVEILKRALANPACPRIDGRLLITSYAAEQLTPQQWKELLARLRNEVGDVFIFLPTVTSPVALMQDYNQGKPINPSQVQSIQANLRQWLDACDGIYFNYPAAFRKDDHTFNKGFYRDIFIPVFKSVLQEPAYHGKYLGLSAYKSHMNPDRSNSLHEDATRTLRDSFEAAMEARPDVLILPEWDEFNENTCFRPTIYGSTTTQRIIRYYMSLIRGKQPTPLHDDDTRLPNLILSARKSVTLGETVMVELLNVPDTSQRRPYTATLVLHDEAGRLLKRFDPVSFDAASLAEHRFHLSTADIPQVQAVVPSLDIQGYDPAAAGPRHLEGFKHVLVCTTWNWDYLFTKQPVRELLGTHDTRVAWDLSHAGDASSPGQPLMLQAQVHADEPIAQIEWLADDDLVYSYDPGNEFHRNDVSRQQLLIEYRSVRNVTLTGSIRLEHGQASWLVPGSVLHQPATEADIDHNRITLDTPASLHKRWVYLSIPTTDIPNAVLVFDFPQARFNLRVQDVFDQRMISRTFEQGLHFAVSPYRKQIDMPFHLRKQQASFTAPVWPEIASEVYHLRVTSITGKAWRSPPLVLPAGSTPPALRRIVAQADWSDDTVELLTQGSRVPVIEYDFAPARGGVLLTPAGRPFWATLGGYTETTTGRGTFAHLLRNYPAQVQQSAPQWIEDQGRPALAFDGQGTFLVLPRETIPARAGWTLEMEIKPDDGRDQVLLVNRILGYRQMGLQLQVVDGKLVASFRNAGQTFRTDLPVPPGQWSAIRASYDLKQLALQVNGRQAAFPLQGPASNIGFTIIGNDDKGQHFKGCLRSLRIAHQPGFTALP